VKSVAKKQKMKKAFTLIELVVAVALLAIIFLFAGVIFKVCINSYRTAVANAEIMQKLRAITDQLNADFKGLRKDGEIFVIWKVNKLDAAAAQYDDYRDCDNDGYERFDRIMFFADGDFQSYSTDPKVIRGNTARICYMLAKDGSGERAEDYNDLSQTEQGRKHREEKRRGRILARTQHILTADTGIDNFPNFSKFTDNDPCWSAWNNVCEYDKTTLDGWKNVSDVNDVLSVIIDVNVGDNVRVYQEIRGTKVDPADSNTIRNLLCEGVGEFKIQGWSFDPRQGRWRWVPEVYPDGDRDLTYSDVIFSNPRGVPGVLYPYPLPYGSYGAVSLSGVFYCDNSPAGLEKFKELQSRLNEERFGEIPGLGRALKFTFTLYDSKGVFKEGRTFTHIVYIGE
jgi:prepilin-type N-terminal cleavage/methylation domain-containing protein